MFRCLVSKKLETISTDFVVMASHYKRVQRCGDDVEPGDVSLSDLTSDSTFVRPSVEAAGESGSMSTELAEPLSAPTHLPQELPPTEGGYGVVGPAGFPSIGVTLGYNNGLPGPF